MTKTYVPWHVDEVWLLPPSVQDLVPPGHVAHFVRDVVRDGVDLTPLLEARDGDRGGPAFHPGMMTALLLYAYSHGIHSSRQIARACAERLDFAAVTGLQRPDSQTIADFRKRHASILARLFAQSLRLCRQTGLARLGQVALAETPARRRTSPPKPMSRKRAAAADAALGDAVRGWLADAVQADREEGRKQAAAKRGEGQPDWFADRASRRARIRDARGVIEAEARARLAAARKGRGKVPRRSRTGRRPGLAPDHGATPSRDGTMTE